jgi:hypothetical protein
MIKKCPHGRHKPYCKDCGGSQICKHSRQRQACRECKGNKFCEHDRQRSQCKECHGSGICKHNIPRTRCGRCNPEGYYRACIRGAKKREIPFNLSLEAFKILVSGSCVYCGESVAPMSCDRIDNKRGYSSDNCQPLCDVCNRMKLTHPEEKFFQHLIKIFSNLSAAALGKT